MKNATVRELIDILRAMDQDAVVCHLELEGDEIIFSTFEICREFSDELYLDDEGNWVLGNVVAIY